MASINLPSSGTTVSSGIDLNGGDTLDVLNLGSAVSTTISGGGVAFILSGGVAIDTAIQAGGAQLLYSSATTTGTTVSGAGAIEILSGGVSMSATVFGGGVQEISSGGIASGATLSGGEQIASGGIASNTVIDAGGVLIVSGRSADGSDATVNAGGVLSVGGIGGYGDLNQAAVVYSGGVLDVRVNGADLGSTIESGGTVYFFSTGQSYGTEVQNGGTLIVESGTIQNGAVIEAGLASGDDASSVVYVRNADVAPGGVADAYFNMVSAGGTIVAGPGGVASGNIFGKGGEEIVANGGSASGDIFNAGSTLDLAALPFSPGGTVTVDPATDLLTVTVGANSYTEQLIADSYASGVLSSDGANGTLIAFSGGVACYCRGTRLLTERGETAVEELRAGDVMQTISGAGRPVRWIGRRAYAGRFLAANPGVWPIRFRAGALADGIPARDLLVSPSHAMFLGGALIPAASLVNGISIARVEAPERVEYFHVELETHDVIFAEGAASETFVDDDSRAMFHNAADFLAAHPGHERKPALYCAPRATGGYAVEAARQGIDERCGLRAPAPSMSLHGHIDIANGGLVEGWAWNPEHPDAPVCVEIVVGGVVATRTLAALQRDDLAAAGVGSGRHGFSVRLPDHMRDAPASAIEVRRSSDRSPVCGKSQATRAA